MNIMADSESTTEEEQQLQKQLENIYLDYQKTLESSQSMAPKDINTRKIGTANNGDEVDDDDLEEIENVSDNIDLLNSALDSIEERADRIRAQLLELLSSNREIRQSIREENEKLQPTNNDGNDDTSGSSSNVDEEQPEN